MKNYYKIIGVSKNASLDHIKVAYLEKMKKYHPDVFAGDKNLAMQKTTELNEAYNTLKDEEKRKEYNLIFKNKNIFFVALDNIKKTFLHIGVFLKKIFKNICIFFNFKKNIKNGSMALKTNEKQNINKNILKYKITIIIQTIIIFILLLILIV